MFHLWPSNKVAKGALGWSKITACDKTSLPNIENQNNAYHVFLVAMEWRTKNLFRKSKWPLRNFTWGIGLFAEANCTCETRVVEESKFQSPHNNVLAHTAIIVQQFLGKKRVSVLTHPAYSPSLGSPDYFAFPKLKMELKGDQCKNILEIQKPVTVKLKAILIHEWEKAMKQLKDHAKECVCANGDDFEWKMMFLKSSLKTYGTHCVYKN